MYILNQEIKTKTRTNKTHLNLSILSKFDKGTSGVVNAFIPYNKKIAK